MQIKRWAMAALVSAATLFSAHAQAGQPLKVGVTAGPYADILRYAGELAGKEGIEVKVIEFTDYTLPNAALAQGDLDLNNFQHQPYLDNQVAARKYEISSIAKSIVVPVGIYSKKLDRLEDVKQGALVAIPNDPSNGARALILLEKAGLIKLKPDIGIKAGVPDIAENPKKLKVKELDAAQLPRSLDDVDLAVVNLNYALTSGLDPKKAIVLEAADTPYNLVFAVRNKDRDDTSIRRFVDLYRSLQVKEFIETKFQGTIIPTW